MDDGHTAGDGRDVFAIKIFFRQVFSFMAGQTILKNVLRIQHGELKRGNLDFLTGLGPVDSHCATASVTGNFEIDGKDYIVLPGFINYAFEPIEGSSIGNQVQEQISQGCTTILCLGSQKIENECVLTLNHLKSSDTYVKDKITVTKNGQFEYKVNDSIASPIAGAGKYYASGSTSVDIWTYLQAKLMLLRSKENMLTDVLEIIMENSVTMATEFETLAELDWIILKLDPLYEQKTAEELLLSVVFQKRSVEGVFKNGKLVYKSEDFSARMKQLSLSKYYENLNVPMLGHHDNNHAFDSIESALEDFSIKN